MKADTQRTKRDEIVSAYLSVLKDLHMGKGDFLFAINNTKYEDERIIDARMLPADNLNMQDGMHVCMIHLHEAHLFEFSAIDFQQLFHLADVYTTEILSGVKWDPSTEGYNDTAESLEVCRKTVREGKKVPFPDKLPFRSCYFAWGVGFPLTETQRALYLGRNTTPGHTAAAILATVVNENGFAWSIVLHNDHTKTTEVSTTIVCEYTKSAGWLLPFGLTPWIVNYVVDIINRNDSLIRVQPGSLREKLNFKQASKQHHSRFIPAPYYTVTIAPTTYDEYEQTFRRSTPREWSHRWDVRAHRAHKLIRGTLPIDEKLIKVLSKRKYEIFHALNPVSSECMAFLMKRRLPPPGVGEWIAYRSIWRRECVKGPADKPYVPSKHRLRGGVQEVI